MNQKKTKIPSNWQQVKLSDVCYKISDGLHSTPKYIMQSDFYFVNGNNLVNDSILIKEGTKCVDKTEYLKYKNDLNNSTILLSINGTIGNLAYYKDEKVILGKSAAYINCSESIKKEYLFNLLKTLKAKYYFNSELTGSTIKNLGLKSIKNLSLLLPPLPEQHRIVKVLETWDTSIEKLTKKIKLKKQLKKGLMQKLLTGEMRLPGFSGEWKVVKLENLADIKKGKGLSKGKLDDNGKFNCILYGELYTKYSEIINTVDSKTNENEGIRSEIGDILIPASTTTNALDLAIASCVNKENILLGGDINILRTKKKYNSKFLAYYLTNAKKHELARVAQGITIVHLYGKDFKKLNICLPEISEQNNIVNIFEVAENEINLLENKLQALKKQKKFLLNNLVTGEIRTPENMEVTI